MTATGPEESVKRPAAPAEVGAEPAIILVVGFGNDLMGDDGLGPAVVEAFLHLETPTTVRAVASAADVLALPSLWEGEAQVWMVDALIRGGAPGSVYELDHDAVLAIPQRHATVHHLSLPEGLRWIALAFPEMATVRYRLWGVEPQRLDMATGLSPAVAQAVTPLAERIGLAAADVLP